MFNMNIEALKSILTKRYGTGYFIAGEEIVVQFRATNETGDSDGFLKAVDLIDSQIKKIPLIDRIMKESDDNFQKSQKVIELVSSLKKIWESIK